MTSSGKKQQKRQFWLIWTIVFLGFFGISMPYLIFPPLFLNPEYSFLPGQWGTTARAVLLGITLSGYPLGQFVGAPILGALSDEYGRKPLLVASLAVTSVCSVVMGVSVEIHHLALLIIARFLAGFMEGNIAIARAMCTDFTALSKQETFGKINAAAAMAYLTGPLLGASMADKQIFGRLSTSTPFYLMAVLTLLLAILTFWVLEKSKGTSLAQRKTLKEQFNLFGRLKRLFSNKVLKVFMIASTYFTLGVDIFYEFAPVYLTAKWLLVPSSLIIYNGLLCLGLILGNGWLPVFISSRGSSRLATLWAMFSFSLLLFLILVNDSPLLMMGCFFLIGIVIGIVVTLLTVKISDASSDSIQGEVLGTQVSLRVLGDGIICLLGGVFLIFSPKIILLVASILSIGTMIYSRKKYS